MNVCKFSQDRKFRYRLDFEHRDLWKSHFDREIFDAHDGRSPWVKPAGRVVWVLLNPSTADEQTLDPTLRRVRDFSEQFGIRNVTIVNLFAWRATNPRELLLQPDPIGPDNDLEILEALEGADVVVLGWGAVAPRLRRRAREVEEILENAGRLQDSQALGTTKHGEPRHPLYMPRTAELEEYVPWPRWVDRGDVEPYRPGQL